MVNDGIVCFLGFVVGEPKGRLFPAVMMAELIAVEGGERLLWHFGGVCSKALAQFGVHRLKPSCGVDVDGAMFLTVV